MAVVSTLTDVDQNALGGSAPGPRRGPGWLTTANASVAGRLIPRAARDLSQRTAFRTRRSGVRRARRIAQGRPLPGQLSLVG